MSNNLSTLFEILHTKTFPLIMQVFCKLSNLHAVVPGVLQVCLRHGQLNQRLEGHPPPGEQTNLKEPWFRYGLFHNNLPKSRVHTRTEFRYTELDKRQYTRISSSKCWDSGKMRVHYNLIFILVLSNPQKESKKYSAYSWNWDLFYKIKKPVQCLCRVE